MENTSLANLYRQGIYVPYTREETIICNSKILEYFYDNGINVIRLGLHYSDELVKNTVAGFYHPAFRELCESRIFYNKLAFALTQLEKGSYTVYVGKSFLSKAIGQKKENVLKLKNLGYNVRFAVNTELKEYKFLIDKEMR
jgi:histone acetyltransferase (RNA polymerase elongator complex component)